MGGLVCIRAEAVEVAMRMCGVNAAEQLTVYDGIMKMADIIIGLRQKKAEHDRKEKAPNA
jgi:hypothetical protein